MKDTFSAFAIVLLCVLILTGCSSEAAEAADTTASSPIDTTVAQATEAATTQAEPEITTAQKLVRAADLTPPALPDGFGRPEPQFGIRGDFELNDPITDADLITPHGYWAGMTMEEAYLIYPFDGHVINEPSPQDTDDYDFWLIDLDGVFYGFVKSVEGPPSSYADYYLWSIGYSERQELDIPVLRGVTWGDTTQQALDKLPGNGQARQWAIDQIMGEEWMPGSMTLTYNNGLGWHELRICAESAWIDLTFGASGKLFIVSVYPNSPHLD